MNFPHFEGWHPDQRVSLDHEPDDVGMLGYSSTTGRSMLLELPEGLTVDDVKAALDDVEATPRLLSQLLHDHYDHLDPEVWMP